MLKWTIVESNFNSGDLINANNEYKPGATCSCEAQFLTLGECPDIIFSLEYSSSIRKGLGNLSPAHVQDEKDDVSAEGKETYGVIWSKSTS